MVYERGSQSTRRARSSRFFVAAVTNVVLALLSLSGSATIADEKPTVTLAEEPETDAAEAPPVKKGQDVNIKDFGAKGDGATNDTPAFNAAFAALAKAGGGRCLVPKGTYLIAALTNPAITSHLSSNVHLVGEGRQVSILKISGPPAGNFLFCSGSNWSVEDLSIDMQDYFVARAGFAAIVATGSNWRIRNCAIIRMGRVGINIKAGENGYVEGNLISKTEPSPLTNSSILGVVDGQGRLPINMHIMNNVCVNSLIYFNGKDSVIGNNRVSGSRFGSNICTGVYSDNVSIINNTCSGGRGRDQTNCVVSGFELWASNSVIANNSSYDNDGPGMTMGGNNCLVVGNRCWDNAHLTGRVGGSGIVARAHARWPNAASGSVFIGNSCYDSRWPHGGMTQAYGYNEVGAGLKGIEQFGNDYDRNRLGPAHYNRLFGSGGQVRVPAAIKERLRALANSNDVSLSNFARRALTQFLAQR